MKKTHCFLLVAILALVLGACDTDEDKDVEANDEQDVDVSDTDENDTDDGTDDGTDTDTGGDFESCIASLKDCNFDDLETPCGSISTIPIPLTGGGTYGPYVIEAGPYGSYVEWNEGEDTEFVNPVNNSEPGCDTFGVLVFGEPPSVNREMLNLRGMKFRLYTIFRPACMKEGEKYPVITWANGTCGQSGGYAALLTTVASHGYVVIASNSRWTDSAPTDNVQLRTLDYAKTLNEDPDSIYYQRLDMDNIGASGHSQGSMATIHSAPDPRVKALITWNGDPSNDKPFLYVTANRDTESRTVKSVTKQVDEATQPGAWLFYHKVLWTGGFVTGHLVLMEQPDRVVDAAVAWWNYWLKGDQEALKMFVGPDCSLCNQDEDFEYGLNSLFP